LQKRPGTAIQPAFAIAPDLVISANAFSKPRKIPDVRTRANGLHGEQRDDAFFKEAVMATGTVKFFNAQKGFGFIVQDNGGPDVFVHISAVERSGMTNLNEGQKLTFDVQNDSRSGKPAAANLQAV
jgi:CspA family cold shock protein